MRLRNITSVYVFHEGKVLLIHKLSSRLLFNKPLWCGVGGHFEEYEINSPKECVLRELNEETGLKPDDINGLMLKYITLRKKGDEIRQQYVYFAELVNTAAVLTDCDEGELHWVEIDRLSGLQMSVTNKKCLDHYFAGGNKDKLVYAGVATVLEDKPHMVFTPVEDFSTDY